MKVLWLMVVQIAKKFFCPCLGSKKFVSLPHLTTVKSNFEILPTTLNYKKKQFFPASAFFGVCLNLFCKGRKNKTKRLKTHRSILVHNNCDLCKTEYCPMFHSSVRPTRAFIIRLILLCQDIQIWFNRWKSHSQCCCQFSLSPGA